MEIKNEEQEFFDKLRKREIQPINTEEGIKQRDEAREKIMEENNK